MNEKGRIAFLTACLFVIGLHLRTAGRLIVEGWVGPYADSGPAEALARGTPPSDPSRDELVPSRKVARDTEDDRPRDELSSHSIVQAQRHGAVRK